MQTSATLDTPLLTALEQLAPPGHLCSIYESPEEHFAVAIPFIRIGLDRGEKCLYIADDGTEEIVRNAMYAEGIDVERAIATQKLVLARKETAYLKHGSFDPDWMFTFWADATAEALSQGFPALRATGETEWVLRGAPGLEQWIEYESRLTHALAHSNCFALCQYNRQLFPPELILDIIRTHPTVIYRGGVCRNMYHVPAEELLGTNQVHEVERLLTNIRERERIEDTLRQQRNELRRSEAVLVEAQRISHTGSWAWMPASGETFCSAEHFRILGLDPSHPLTSPDRLFEMVHPDDRSDVRRTFQQAMAHRSEVDLDYRIVRPDGTIRDIHSLARPVLDHSGNLLEYVGAVVDITEQRRAEAALRSSEERWRLVFENSAIGIVLAEGEGKFVEANRAFQELVGYSNEELRTLTSMDITHEADIPRGTEVIQQLQSGSKREVQLEKRYRHKDGRYIWVRATGTAIPGSDSSPRYLLGLVEDVTDRKIAEQELAASVSQLHALAGRLMHAQDDERRRIARILHETTAQDLAALKMLLARLNRTASHLGESDRGALTDSISLAEQSMTEIRTLSYLLHPPFLDEMGLLSALRWYAVGFADRSGITVDLELPESFERLPRDTETALFRIVQESLINIHQHAESETARIRLRRDAETLVLEIEDRGRGIPSESLKFIMGDGGGAGVGIAGMCERIEQLGGSLEITSGDSGTTVHARLPLGRDAR
jgi:PAS domain S-box-containing protein